jgi:hypothetical protein
VRLEAPERIQAGEVRPVRISFAARYWSARDGALLRVLQEGVLIASATPQRLRQGSARFALRIPGSARPGVYDLAFDLVGAPERDLAARLEVVPGSWTPPVLPGDEPPGQPVVQVWDVGRTLQGLPVLRAGTDTFDHKGGTQLAQLDVEHLRARCGLRDDADSPWGYGFCGLEIRGVKAVTVDLRNTFAEAVQNGCDLGDRYRDSFAGFVVDYHTPRGYTKRVALGLGVVNGARPVATPHWGKVAPPDECLAWSRTILEKPHDLLTVDLARHAPPDWDGQAWFSVGVDTVSRGLQFEAEIRSVEGGKEEKKGLH